MLGWLLWGIGTDPVLGRRIGCSRAGPVSRSATSRRTAFRRISISLSCRAALFDPMMSNRFSPHPPRITQESGLDFSRRLVCGSDPMRSRPRTRVLHRSSAYAAASTSQARYLCRRDSGTAPGARDDRAPVPRRLPLRWHDPMLFVRRVVRREDPGDGAARTSRDLYDIVNLFRRNDLRMYPDVDSLGASRRSVRLRTFGVPTASDFTDSPLLVELESEWDNMLGHQLPALPPLAPFLEELPLSSLGSRAMSTRSSRARSPTARTRTRRGRHPRASRHGEWACRSRRCVSPPRIICSSSSAYHGGTRLIEPYSFATDARRQPDPPCRTSRRQRTPLVSRRARSRVSAQRRHRSGQSSRSSSRPEVRCMRHRSIGRWSLRRAGHRDLVPGRHLGSTFTSAAVGREFAHTKRNATLRAHQDSYGSRCSGRHGRYIGERY